MKIKKILFIILFVGIVFSLKSQTDTRNQLLLDMSNQRQADYLEEKRYADSIATANNFIIKVVLPDGRLTELQGFRNGIPVYYITDNAGAAITTRTNRLYSGGGLGLSLSGSGYNKLGEWDGGAVLATHQELTGRITQVDGATTTHYHATHVAGTLIGEGHQANAKGMAYAATLKAYEWTNDESEMVSAAALGMEVSNHSYGTVRGWAYGNYLGTGNKWFWFGSPSISTTEDYLFGFYNSSTQYWDSIAYNAPNYLIVKSAGNDRGEYPSSYTNHFVYNGGWVKSSVVRENDGGSLGYDCVGDVGVAKNILTVGAVGEVSDYNSPSSVVMSSFSGWGPADDGRIKPDIVAKGVSVYSVGDGSDSEYLTLNGTSMASPNATGTLALLQQHYQNTHSSAIMRSSTLKALVLHTADEAGAYDGPDYVFGWGLLNAEAAANRITEDTVAGQNVIDEQTLTNNGTYTRSVTASGNEPLKVTICWTDPKGTPVSASLDPTNSMLVHDLNLKITKDGLTYYPWKLDGSNPTAKATKTSKNHIDNVEMVYIASPSNGSYTITVNHDGTLARGSQVFSIIISGIDEFSNTPTSCSSALVSPSNGATSLDLSTQIEWEEVTDATSYDVYFGTDGSGTSTPTNIENGTNVTTNIYHTALSASTTYYLQVKPRNSSGVNSGCSTIWSFSTGAGSTPITSFPYTENFDAFFVIGTSNDWQNKADDDIDWTVQSGATPSASVGPAGDHTSGSGKYLYVEASVPNSPFKSANLLSPYFNFSSSSNPVLEFWYSLVNVVNESQMGDLYIDIFDNGQWHSAVFSVSGNQGADWKSVAINLSDYKSGSFQQIRFRVITGSGWASDIGIDDVQISDGLTNTWLGTTANWNSSSNWSRGYVPASSGVDVSIPTSPSGGSNFPVISSGSYECNNLTISSTATTSLTISGGAELTINGDLTINSGGSVSNSGTINLKGDWTNSGTFTTNSGSVEFQGESTQIITDNTSNFNSFTVDADNGLSLSNDLQVDGTLTLRNGRLNIGSNNLILGSSASISGTPSQWNMIVADGSGEVRKTVTGTGSFEFPVGDNTGTAEYSPLTVNFNSGSFSSAYVGVKVTNSKHPNNPSGSDFLNRYWTVTTSGITGFNYNIDLNYTEADVNGTEASMKFVKYSGGVWSDLGSVSASTNLLSATNLTSFSDFTGGEDGIDGSALSVELLSFESVCSDNKTKLLWITSSETNNKEFIVEESENGLNFKEIAKIGGAGNSNAESVYSLMVSGTEELCYYKLCQIDFDGKINQLKTIYSNCQQGNRKLTIYPNPFNNQISITNLSETVELIKIMDIYGKIVLEKTQINESKLELDLSNLKSGIYYLIMVSDKIEIEKTIKI